MSQQSSIAHYRIVSKLGEGGMGVVYRATDTKLNRDVAIKVLPPAFAEDAARMQRFEREARVLASLNHPNIAAIHGIEQGAIVMELVEGANLTGPVPIEMALDYACQIAAGLGAAHEKGIVHRDLKPANIRVTPNGQIKILDFGLAKATDVAPAPDSTQSPTVSLAVTQAGVVLGSAAYMSPEQARGKPVDKRADIWAFGVILFELLTGRKLFGGGETVSDVLASLIAREPDLSTVPERVRPVLKACLEKDPRNRLHDIGDWQRLLADASPPAAVGVSRLLVAWVVALLAVILAVAAGIGWWRAARPQERPLVRMDIDFGADLVTPMSYAISPDGNFLAFIVAGDQDEGTLFGRRWDEDKPKQLARGRFNNLNKINPPFFSPDSKWIGFYADRKLKKVPVEGGPAVNLADVSAAGPASWGEAGEIVAQTSFSGYSRIPADGGTSSLLKGIASIFGVSYLPGGKTILYSGTNGIGAISSSGKISLIAPIPAYLVQYVPGFLLFIGEGDVLYGMPFDAGAIKPTGTAFPLLEGVDDFNVSSAGTMIVHRGKPPGDRVIYWFDETGRTEPLIDKPGSYRFPRLSPDGKRLALAMGGDDGWRIWVRDLPKGPGSQVTFNNSATYPVWTPDGRYLFYRGADGIYLIRADGAGSPRRLLENGGFPESVSPDGRRLAYYVNGESTKRDIWIAPLEGTGDELRAGKPEPFATTAADEIHPEFSPDGKWIAYASSESEDGFGVYVRPASGGPGKWSVSSGVYAAWPAWAPAGHRLFFFAAFNGRLMAVDYTVKGESFVAGTAKDFGVAGIAPDSDAPVYFVSGSGDRAGAVLYPPQTAKGSGHSSYTLFQNYIEEIRRRGAKAPVK